MKLEQGMERIGVKKLAQLSGVSIKTLHHYDKIGLLRPAQRSEAGYRQYGEEEMLRLQQILFYKELDFSLQEIKAVLDDPEFDLIKALKTHRKALDLRQKRIKQLLQTLDKTIEHVQKRTMTMKPEELYEGMPKEKAEVYRKGAIDEYGEEAVQRSEAALTQLGKAGFQALKEELEQLTQQLFSLKNEPHDGDVVQRLIGRHYAVIRAFWGTMDMEDKQAEAYAGLGTLYVADPNFVKVNGEPRPELAAFMEKAMEHFAAKTLDK